MKAHVISIHQTGLKGLSILVLTLLFGLFTSEASAQSTERTITGVVQSIDGPVVGATVLLEGTLIGTYTDENGKFTFPQKLKENDVLICSALGYNDATAIITGDISYVEPFLGDNPVIIVAALRTAPTTKTTVINNN